MKKKTEPLIVALDELAHLARSGTVCRTAIAIALKPEGLTLEDICEISGMTPGNVRSHGIPPLIRAQVVRREKTPEGIIFRINRLLEVASSK